MDINPHTIVIPETAIVSTREKKIECSFLIYNYSLGTSFRLVINLMVVNVISCVLMFPAITLEMAKDSLNFSEVSEATVCISSSVFSSLVAHTSIFAMLTVGLDQYLAVIEPLEYSTKVTEAVSWQLIAFVWIMGGMASAVSTVQMATRQYPSSSCMSLPFQLDQYQRIILFFVSFIFYLIPIILLVFVYVRIFCAANRSSKYIRKSSTVNLERPNILPKKTSIESDSSEEVPRVRPPKLAALRSHTPQGRLFSQSVFEDDVFMDKPRSHLGKNAAVNHQRIVESQVLEKIPVDKRHNMLASTTKRKCSFSSISEFRLVGNGGKTKTVLFSIDASSTNLDEKKGSIDSTDEELFGTPENAAKLGGRQRSKASLKTANSSASLLSITSQAARRLSGKMSQRASSIYHFINEKEELRAAKVAGIVLVFALVCWSPFVGVIGCLAFEFSSEYTVFWLHFVSQILTLAFAAMSPYIYVFRSEKVQKSLLSIIKHGFSSSCCRRRSSPYPPRLPRRRWGSISYYSHNAKSKTASLEDQDKIQVAGSLVWSREWKSCPNLVHYVQEQEQVNKKAKQLRRLNTTFDLNSFKDQKLPSCCDRVKKSAGNAFKKLIIKPETTSETKKPDVKPPAGMVQITVHTNAKSSVLISTDKALDHEGRIESSV